MWTIGGKDEQPSPTIRKSNNHSKELTPVPKARPTDGILLDQVEHELVPHQPATPEQIQEWLDHLLINPNGILYEDNYIQIGLKTEYDGQIGRLAIFYGNKLPGHTLNNFQRFIPPNDQVKFSVFQELSGEMLPLTQCHEIYNVDCQHVPTGEYRIAVMFQVGQERIQLGLCLPVTISKFITPIHLGSDDFIARWKQTVGPPREIQTVFKPRQGIRIDHAKRILSGSQFELLPGVDPNEFNVTCAGIFSAVNIGKAGCLLRLESNVDQQVVILT